MVTVTSTTRNIPAPAKEISDYLFVLNPHAGNDNVDWKKFICESFACREEDIEAYELDEDCSIPKLRKRIAESAGTCVVAAGGDGTVKLVAECLVDLENAKTLGILPGGSANGLAKELGISASIPEALSELKEQKQKSIHLVTVNDELCIHLSDIGFNAFVVKVFDSLQRRGMWGYIRAAWKVLWQHSAMRVSLKIDGKQVRRKAVMVVIANATRYGSGALINPSGKLNDELFEVVIVKKVSFSELFKMMISHRPFDKTKTEVLQTHQFSMHSKKLAHFQIDGEYCGRVHKVDAKLLPAAITVIAGTPE